MKNMAKICSVFCRYIDGRTALFIALLALATAPICVTAYAEDDPFQLEGGHWMSFDHYKDADKRGLLPVATPKAETVATPTEDGTPVPNRTATPAVAAPSRPIDLPVMPGMNKGFEMQINSTEDEKLAPSPVIDANNSGDIHLTDKNWQSPASALRFIKTVTQDADAGGDPLPLDVRLSYLPDSKVTPVPSPEHESAEHKARTAMETGAKLQAPPPPPEKAQPAVCAAIDAYKKQQLTAIQSDRETLKALQDAIASLGLQKQLGFMTSSASALNGGQNTPQGTIDIPASTSLQ